MDGPTQTAKERKEPSDMDGSTKELKTDSTVEELKNGSPVRRSLALFLGIFALFSLGGSAARVVARADATTLRLHAVPDFELTTRSNLKSLGFLMPTRRDLPALSAATAISL